VELMAEHSDSRRRIVIFAVAKTCLLALIGGIAIAAVGEAEAPVVTVDSGIQEQIGALEFQIGESATELQAATSEAESDLLQRQIDVMEAKVAQLCSELTSTDAAEVPEACAG
jgi:hypothetical protein